MLWMNVALLKMLTLSDPLLENLGGNKFFILSDSLPSMIVSLYSFTSRKYHWLFLAKELM